MVSSFDSSSQSHRAIRPSWTEIEKTIISNGKCVTALTAITVYVGHFDLNNSPLGTHVVDCDGHLRTKSVVVILPVKILYTYSKD